MSIIATRYPNRHRPAPMREAIALRCKTLVYCSPLQLKIQLVGFDMACLDDVSVRQFGLIAESYDRVRTQIPIDRRLF
ncbi:MAG TPA: hypothetical protein VMV99_16375 [Rhodanobacter sp.]|nr:hypothetical protein [Rhodanobacter sp.]